MAGTSSAVAARMRGSSMINLPAGLPKMARHDIEEQQLRLCGFSDYKLAVKKTGRRYQGRERAMKRHSHTFAAIGVFLSAVSAPAAAFAQKPGGILRIPHGDSPASMSTHEEATRSTATPMMGVFNNLVLFHLKRPQPFFTALLASGASPVYPCHVSPAQMRQHPIGTGPFKFVEYKPNELIRLIRNPDYWKPRRPYLDGIEYTIISC